jgi:Transglycosylase-like domain
MWSGDTSVPDSKWRQDQLERKYMRLHGEAGRMGGNPGRNVLVWGVDTRDGDVREPKKAELRRSIPILERMTTPVQPAIYSSAPSASYSSAPPAANGTLEAVAACESGGDPTAVGGGGLHRGKYQFTYETWQSVGGTGDPAAAPEAEQDARAAMLLERDGAGHWPVCGG